MRKKGEETVRDKEARGKKKERTIKGEGGGDK
jgi:hypothetical protein